MTRTPTHILAELLGVPYSEKRELLDEFVASLRPAVSNGKPIDNRPLWNKLDEISASVPDEAWASVDPSAAGADVPPDDPAPQPSPVQLQVGHRYRARDGSEWDMLELGAAGIIGKRAGTVGGRYSWAIGGAFHGGRPDALDLIEDLGPTPSAALDIDAVLAPFREAERAFFEHSNDQSLTTEVTATYAIAGSMIRKAMKKAREVARD